MEDAAPDREKPAALSLLASERPRNVSWFQAAGLLFGDWGTSRLYVLGLAFLVAGRSSFYLIAGMSLLILMVGWAYTQICRIYTNGGGVYTAGRRRHALIGVIGALLLFADYTVTASLSAVEAFHYFGLGAHKQVQEHVVDAGDHVIRQTRDDDAAPEPLWRWDSPGLWAIVAILVIGAFNLLGPKHTAGYAMFAAAGMVVITLLIVAFALPQIDFANLKWGRLFQPIGDVWYSFVYIVLALSGVEAIANLTGVMRRPVGRTARKAIWVVACEVAAFNCLLALIMLALASGGMGREDHTEDMLAYMARVYIGPAGEWPVRILGGLLLLSATNTAVNGLMSITYVMSRDGELPRFFQRLNGFGAPWIAALLAAAVPATVLLFFHDLKTLASMYAIGVVGAVALDCSLTTFHPRLRRPWRKLAMAGLAMLLIVIWITLALTKVHALVFVCVVMATGLILRQATRYAAARRPKPSLLRQAILEQLTPEALARPRLMLTTAGSDQLAESALERARDAGAALVVCFVRDVALSYKVEAETQLSLDTDQAAQALFVDFLDHGHRLGVPIIPVYDCGPDPAVLIAEHAAVNGVQRVLVGTSRRGALHQIIKGSFRDRLQNLLPTDIPIEMIAVREAATAPA